MGNTTSTNKQGNRSFSRMVNLIATNYILTQNFKDLKKLADPKYCDDLVILTSKILNENLTNLQIKYLAQHTSYGNIVDKLTRDHVLFFPKNRLSDYDVSSSVKKKRICIGIAKYYVKVAHIFAAITTTLKPMYSFSSPAPAPAPAPEGQVDLQNKENIPDDATDISVKQVNLCSNRINALLNHHTYAEIPKDQTISIQPVFCTINREGGVTKHLNDEPGIPELEALYNNVYNFKEGGFTGMNDTMQKVYDKDLQTFFKAFTRKKTMPSDIKKFSDIKLKDYSKLKGCSSSSSPFNRGYKGNLRQKLFADYAENIRTMVANTETQQAALLEVLKSLFTEPKKNPKTGKLETTINPKLTGQLLQKLTEDTRTAIVKLYTGCEEDFVKGLKIFEAIVEKHIKDKALMSIDSLGKPMEQPVEDESQPQHAAMEPQPAAMEPQPAAAEPQPAAAEPQPPAMEPQPAAMEPQPQPAAMAAPVMEPQPVAVPPAPALGGEDRAVPETNLLAKLNPEKEIGNLYGQGEADVKNVVGTNEERMRHLEEKLRADIGGDFRKENVMIPAQAPPA